MNSRKENFNLITEVLLNLIDKENGNSILVVVMIFRILVYKYVSLKKILLFVVLILHLISEQMKTS